MSRSPLLTRDTITSIIVGANVITFAIEIVYVNISLPSSDGSPLAETFFSAPEPREELHLHRFVHWHVSRPA